VINQIGDRKNSENVDILRQKIINQVSTTLKSGTLPKALFVGNPVERSLSQVANFAQFRDTLAQDLKYGDEKEQFDKADRRRRYETELANETIAEHQEGIEVL